MSSASPSPARRLNPDAVRALLARRVMWCRLSPEQSRLFAARRQEEFRHLLYLGWPLLILMWLVIGIGGLLLFPAELTGPEGVRWWRGLGALGATLAVPIMLLHLPRLQPHYQQVIFVFGALVLAIALLGGLLPERQRLAQANSYVALLIISILMLALRLSLLVSTLTVLAGFALAVTTVVAMGRPVDWVMLAWFCVGGLVVMIFVGAVLERQERVNFLQGLLLEHEASERERLNRQLERLAQQDSLTHLANRRHFDRVLEQEWERARRETTFLAALFIDVDYFKPYNDTYGHAAGDDCLVEVSKVLADAARRPGDLAARYGGEEFVILLPRTDAAGAQEVAERILTEVDALALPHAGSRVATHVTVSIGLAAVVPPPGEPPQKLLELADRAVYAAKREGRHRVVAQEMLARSA